MRLVYTAEYISQGMDDSDELFGIFSTPEDALMHRMEKFNLLYPELAPGYVVRRWIIGVPDSANTRPTAIFGKD